MPRFNFTSCWLFILLITLNSLASVPAYAQDPDDGPILVPKESAVMNTVAKGKGWFQIHVSDSENPRRGVVSDLLFVTPGGIDTLPVSEEEKQELRADFGLRTNPNGPRDRTMKDERLAGIPGMPMSELQKPALPSEAAPDKGACTPSGGGGTGGGGIIVIDRTYLQQIQQLKALNPGYADSGWEDGSPQAEAKGCFGWNDKTKNKSWSLNDSSISRSFDLAGGFTGNFQVSLPFNTTGNATLKYRIKKFACVPYKFRFTSISAQGAAQLGGTATLSASASLAHSWEKDWKVFDPQIATINFWVGPIPVWINVNLPTYVGVGLDTEVSASVSLDANFGATGSFEYTCTTANCCGTDQFQDHFDTNGISASLEAKIDAEASARVMVRAELWDDSIFYGEAGVKAFVGADLWGYYGNACGDADGDGNNETVEALVADAEAGYDWVFGIGGALAPDKDWTRPGTRYPLGFWDLLGDGGSTALSPMLVGPESIQAGGTATYNAKMRPCYPYTDAVNLSIGPGQWNGNLQIAQPKATTPAQNSTTLSRAFTQAGDQTISLTATTDAKDRELGTLTQRNLEVISNNPPINPKRGLWYNPARSGNGISFYSNSASQYVLTWYTYTASGTPIWYISDAGTKSATSWSQPLYKVTMNSNGTVSSSNVGQVGLDFSAPGNATFSWTLNGQSGSEPYQYFFGGTGRSGLWYPPSQSGWGITVSEGSNTIVATATIYSAGGQPIWFQGAVSPAGPDVTVAMDRYTSPDLCPSCGGNTGPTASPAGNLRLRVASGSSSTGYLSTTINAAGTVWNRTNVPISILTTP